MELINELYLQCGKETCPLAASEHPLAFVHAHAVPVHTTTARKSFTFFIARATTRRRAGQVATDPLEWDSMVTMPLRRNESVGARHCHRLFEPMHTAYGNVKDVSATRGTTECLRALASTRESFQL